MSSEHQQVFDKEVATIRRNPKLAGKWGTLQEYIKALKGLRSANYTRLDDGRVCEIITEYIDNAYCLTITVPKKECQRQPPSRYKKHEIDVKTMQLPDDLQEALRDASSST